ncbi:hypothetical protein BRD02_08765 [Halobacteriales archaeon QS_8_69_73]|nr:MAG: hypothetical protein BRD02_08765 [Halobacteriales archaeon QS_8_69_73]
MRSEFQQAFVDCPDFVDAQIRVRNSLLVALLLHVGEVVDRTEDCVIITRSVLYEFQFLVIEEASIVPRNVQIVFINALSNKAERNLQSLPEVRLMIPRLFPFCPLTKRTNAVFFGVEGSPIRHHPPLFCEQKEQKAIDDSQEVLVVRFSLLLTTFLESLSDFLVEETVTECL